MGPVLVRFGIELIGAVGSFGIDVLSTIGHLFFGGG